MKFSNSTQIIKYTIYSNSYTNHSPIEFIVESPYSNYTPHTNCFPILRSY